MIFIAAPARTQQSIDYFNAEVITKHQVSTDAPPDSHISFQQRSTYHYGGRETYLTTAEGMRTHKTESSIRKRARNSNLKRDKPVLFNQLKCIAEEISKISGNHMKHYFDARDRHKNEHDEDKLTFGKITFVSPKTRDEVFQSAHMLMSRLTPGEENKTITPSFK